MLILVHDRQLVYQDKVVEKEIIKQVPVFVEKEKIVYVGKTAVSLPCSE